jgi:hypothetical protein
MGNSNRKLQPDDRATCEHPMMRVTTSQFQQSIGSSRTTASHPTATPHSASQNQLSPRDNAPSVSGTSNPLQVPTTTTLVNDQPDPADLQQAQGGSDSDTDVQPRFSAAEKGKRPVVAVVAASWSEEEEEDPPLEDAMRESATPTPHYAQVSDLLRSTHALRLTTLPEP